MRRLIMALSVIAVGGIAADAFAQGGGCRRGSGASEAPMMRGMPLVGGASPVSSAELASRFLQQGYEQQRRMAYLQQMRETQQSYLRQVQQSSLEEANDAAQAKEEKRQARIAALKERREAELKRREAAKARNLARREAAQKVAVREK